MTGPGLENYRTLTDVRGQQRLLKLTAAVLLGNGPDLANIISPVMITPSQNDDFLPFGIPVKTYLEQYRAWISRGPWEARWPVGSSLRAF